MKQILFIVLSIPFLLLVTLIGLYTFSQISDTNFSYSTGLRYPIHTQLYLKEEIPKLTIYAPNFKNSYNQVIFQPEGTLDLRLLNNKQIIADIKLTNTYAFYKHEPTYTYKLTKEKLPVCSMSGRDVCTGSNVYQLVNQDGTRFTVPLRDGTLYGGYGYKDGKWTLIEFNRALLMSIEERSKYDLFLSINNGGSFSIENNKVLKQEPEKFLWEEIFSWTIDMEINEKEYSVPVKYIKEPKKFMMFPFNP